MDWNDRYKNADTPWDKGQAAPALQHFLREHPLTGRVLVPGCGIGHDARAIAEGGASVVGIDIAPLALEKALLKHESVDLDLSFQCHDFLDSQNALPTAAFDWLFEHTCFCALPPERREAYVAAAARQLKPAAQLLGIFFTHLESPDGPPYPSSHDEIVSLFSPYFEITQSQHPVASFPGRENEETLFRMTRK